jgi:hypothetical protein
MSIVTNLVRESWITRLSIPAAETLHESVDLCVRDSVSKGRVASSQCLENGAGGR